MPWVLEDDQPMGAPGTTATDIKEGTSNLQVRAPGRTPTPGMIAMNWNGAPIGQAAQPRMQQARQDRWILEESASEPKAAPKTPMQMLEQIPSGIQGQASSQSAAQGPTAAEKFAAEYPRLEAAMGAGETALAMGSGMLGGIAGGIRGAAARIGGAPMPEAEQKAMETAGALTYQPRSQTGQAITEKAAEVLGSLPPISPGFPTGAIKAGIGGAAMKAEQAVGRTVSPLFEKFITKTPQEAIAAMPGVGAAEAELRAQRLARAENLPVPVKPTEGTLSRDLTQQKFESDIAKTEEGLPLRERNAENNARLMQNFDVYQEQTGGTAPTMIELGKRIDNVTRNRMMAAKSEVDTKYKIARQQGAMNDELPVDSLIDYANKNISSATNAPVLNVISRELKRLGAAEIGPEGDLIPTGKPLPIYDLEEIRKTIGANSTEGANSYFGPPAKRIIDQLTEGQGGETYKAARRSYERYANEFKNQGAIAKILATKPGTTDRAIAYEDVWQKAVPGEYSIQDLRNLRTTLFRGGPKGAQAWRDLQGVTIDWLKEQATKNKSVTDAYGQPIVSPAGMSKALKTISDEKLDLIFGKNNAAKLRELSQVIDDLNIPVAGAVNYSNTASSIKAMIIEGGITFAATGVPLPIGSGLKFVLGRMKDKKMRLRIEKALSPSREASRAE